MDWAISAEMTNEALQLAIYFVTAVGAFFSFMLTARA